MYQNDFYDRYAKQLEEPLVRQTHDKMFQTFNRLTQLREHDHVIDLGCGTGEYRRYTHPRDYAGFDEADVSNWFTQARMGVHFSQKDFVKDIDEILKFKFHGGIAPNVFVSLFATEIHLPCQKKYHLYKKIFDDAPHIKAGMVSGFYYTDKLFCEWGEGEKNDTIVENIEGVGQFTVHQTVEDQDDWVFPEFTEYRTFQRVPSEMFGPNIVEVWKFFVRN